MPEPAFVIRPFQRDDAEAFAALNRRWINEFFNLEQEDLRVFADPQNVIIAPGGYIAMAQMGDRAIGTGALMARHDMHNRPLQRVELVKMATAPDAQGMGVGGALLDHLIAKAQSMGAASIWLETNDRLAAATRLYKTKGFEALSPKDQHPTPYSRCNLQMELTF